MDTKLEEIHPGEILLEEFLKPMGITNARLAEANLLPEIKRRIRPLELVAE